MDGFTASPQTHSTPPSHGILLWLLLQLLPLRVAGAGSQALPNPFTPRRARPAAVRAWYRAAARRSSSRSA
ncbi:hypothetical protein EKL94_05910 [Stenotrophomonas maltophilia]|uniref:Uncharacterized protein n=1 Tax=Stenotrophomonas maltophilia TaxID=40324 RepID=A0A431ULP0_STEMA|nr:hypothetical protein EKL94_05910 [Stenotrophomonas maltophilia]